MRGSAHRNRDLPGLIHLAGADGTGKTTQARAIMAWLGGQGVPARYVWLRYPRYFCTPFLAYARLRGYSWQESFEGHLHGYWEFQRSWLMRAVFPWAVLLDATIIGVIGVYAPRLRGLTVVCDRFVADILVDLMTGLNDLDLDRRLVGRLFLRLLPRSTRLVVLDLDPETARRRSPELAGDRSQALRRQAYQGLAARHGWPVVTTDVPVEAVTGRIVSVISQAPEKKPNYAKMNASLLAPILERPAGALAAHWAFQGLLAMDPTERVFKLGLDALLWLGCARALRGLKLPAGAATVLGFVAAHTANFLFNGQIWGVLKHYGGVRRTRREFDAEVAGLQARIAGEPSIVYAAAYGSLARGEWSPTSDLDVRLVRAPGLRNAWRAATFALAERTRALWRRFPLDLLVWDDCSALDRMAERNAPVVLADKAGGRA